MIHTPRLCGEPIFVGGSSPAADDAAEKKKKELNVIECRPVVRDELYLQYLNAGKNDGPGEAPGLPEAASDETSKVTEAGSGDTAPASEPADTTSKEGYPKQDAKTDSTQESLESSKQGDTSADSSKDKAQIEEFVLGSYTLVYDRDTGEMTVNPDPADLVKSELEAGKSDEAAEGMSQNEAEAMEALLNQFRKSLEEMMQNVGGALKNAKSDATSIQDTIKKVQEAYEAAASGPAVGGPEDTANLAKGGKDGQEQAQSPQKADPISRLTRTGAHNHRKIAEKYLKGQLGLSAGKKPKFHHTRSEPGQLHRQREAKQQKMGTAQFRNLKRAFEQKWDDGASDNASPEEKSEGVDKAKNVPPPQQPAHPAAVPRGHDEL